MAPKSFGASPDRAAAPPFRVLCVDDYADTADVTARLLRAVGFEALACQDGQAALRTAATFCPDVCFLDLNMPDMDGDELARQIALLPGPWPLLVAVTAMGDEDARERIVRAGFDLHLVKPVDPQKLVAVVDALFQYQERRGEEKPPGPESAPDSVIYPRGV